MRRTTQRLSLTLLAGLLASQVHAEELNPSWYALPGISLLDSGKVWNAEDNGFGPSLKFGKPLSQNLDLQLGGSFLRNKGTIGTVENKYRQNSLGADVLWLFSRDKVRPFLSAGLGIEQDKIELGTFNESRRAPYLGIGAGLQFQLTEQLFAQFDAKRQHGFISNNTWGESSSKNNIYTLALGWAFDAPRKPAPAVAAVEPLPAPLPVAAPTPALPPQPVFEKVTLSASELFAFDSAVLAKTQPKLDEMASALKTHPEIGNIVINGYTDLLGSDKYNLRLSQQRADSVKAYLVAQGVDATRIAAVGKGKASPVVTCGKEIKGHKALVECLAPNRRVEVEQISYQKQVK